MTASPQTTPDKKALKETLNLPQTEFSMRANAANREPEIQAQWEANTVYEHACNQRKSSGAEPFVLHDGPPYLSGPNIHIGHALNKILKDIVTRFQYQRGHYAPYVPGYDGHGLPIENAVVKKIKGGRAAISPVELREKCRQFGLDNLKGQETHFKRLGVWGNWEQPYITTDKAAVAEQLRLFGQMMDKGYIYKGLKPVYWSPVSETALADAEVEYADHTSHSIYVGFKFKSGISVDSDFKSEDIEEKLSKFDALLTNTQFIIWTTTPWTLPSNLALSVHPRFEYVVAKTENHGKILVAKELLTDVIEKTEAGTYEELGTVTGKDLELVETQHPFLNQTSTVLCGEHVTLDAGTGVVHTAPGHGMDDYVICQNYDRDQLKSNPLGIVSYLNDKGVFRDDTPEPRIRGLFYEKANEVVLDILREKSALLGHSTFVHSYPHDWRTHTPVIYRATDQWFVNIGKVRNNALTAIDGTTFIPERGKTRIHTMVENRTDWCISRQRVWGVPIPAFYDKATKELVTHEALVPHIVSLVDEHGSDVWWAWDEAQLLADLPDAVKTELGLPERQLVKDTDIMDVWFDSGVTHTTVVQARNQELGDLPAQLYLEGSDQHRGWFQSSLLTSVMLRGTAPYEQVLTHGFVLDGDGRKMSKSQGNVIDPLKIINQYGADVLRLWVASVDYSVDVRIGNTIITQLVEVYKKIRNTVRFLLGNLSDFNPATDAIPQAEWDEKLDLLDKYTLHRLSAVHSELTEAFNNYHFHKFSSMLQNFCVVDLSQLYFDVAKDILYTYPVDHPERRAMQTVLYEILKTLVPMLVPVLPHLAEDIWQNLPEHQRWNDAPSGVLLDWPELDIDVAKETNAFTPYLAIRELANDAMESLRKAGTIGGGLEATLTIAHPDTLNQNLLTKVCLVSQLSLNQGELSVIANAAQGEKCPRCWKVIDPTNPPTYHPCEPFINSASLQ